MLAQPVKPALTLTTVHAQLYQAQHSSPDFAANRIATAGLMAERRPSLWTPKAGADEQALKEYTPRLRRQRSSSPVQLTERRTLRGVEIPEAPPPDSEWAVPEDVAALLPDFWQNAVQSIENTGTEFSYYCRRYQFDTPTPYQTMVGLLASWANLDRNLATLKDAVDHLNEEQRRKAGGESGIQRILEAITYRQFYVDEYRAAMEKVVKEGIEEDPHEDAMT